MKRSMTRPPQREKLECPLCPRWCWKAEEDLLRTHILTDHPESHLTPKDSGRGYVASDRLGAPVVAPSNGQEPNGQVPLEIDEAVGPTAVRRTASETVPAPARPTAVPTPATTGLITSLLAERAQTKGASATLETSAGPLEIMVIVITPETAPIFLNQNLNNRPVRELVIRAYAKDMTNMTWRMTGEALVFDTNNLLVEGQHRLMACIRSGQPFETLVIRGVLPVARNAGGRGAKRSLGDALKWQGEVNLSALAAAIILGWRWDHGVPTTTEMPSTTEALDWLDSHPQVRTAVKLVIAFTKAPLKLSPSAAGAVLTRALIIDEDTANLFVQAILEDSHEQGDAILAFRRWALRNAQERSSLRGWISAGFMVKTWNAWLSGQQVTTLTFRSRGGQPEQFPSMISLDGPPHPFPDILEERARKAEARRAARAS